MLSLYVFWFAIPIQCDFIDLRSSSGRWCVAVLVLAILGLAKNVR
jgi:hypothetical protein